MGARLCLRCRQPKGLEHPVSSIPNIKAAIAFIDDRLDRLHGGDERKLGG